MALIIISIGVSGVTAPQPDSNHHAGAIGALRALELTQERDPMILDTLAYAYTN